MSATAGTRALRHASPVAGSRIVSIGTARGEHVVANDEIIGPINSSDEWIRSRTGIATRVRAGADVDVVDLATEAATDAVQRAERATGLGAADIDAVIMSTVTYFRQTPQAAAVVAARIGATPAAAYDISAACAGFTYGLAQADALVRSGVARTVLVIGAEKMSDFIDPTDRSISFLLGDGAGAAIVTGSEVAAIGPTVWGTDGTRAELIGQTEDWQQAHRSGEWPTLRQEGPAVFKWASFRMAPVALQAIEAAGLTPADIDVFVPHQANLRIVDQLTRQIGLPDTVTVARDIVDSGNTSAASIPLAIERLYRDGAATSGDIALLIGFGAGLTYGAQVVVLP